MALLLSQRNQLFDAIIKTDYFSPSMFNIQDSDTGCIISYGDSDFFFIIKPYNKPGADFVVNMSPAENTISKSHFSFWVNIPQMFDSWLTFLKREITAPDKWGRLFEEMQYLSASKTEYDGKFSHGEYLDLQSKFMYLKAGLPAIPMTTEQIDTINHKLDHLLSMVTELSKFDWQTLFIGTIMSIIIQLGVTQDNAAALYALIKQTFSGMFLQ